MGVLKPDCFLSLIVFKACQTDHSASLKDSLQRILEQASLEYYFSENTSTFHYDNPSIETQA